MARIARAEVVNYLKMTYGTQSSVNIDELPDSLRHSCVGTGITFLPQLSCPVANDEYMNLSLPYYYCQFCGKLYVYSHLYD